MSVKKSLWIGLALAAVALLIVGCSTEDGDSEGGSFSYQKTALWEAVSAAQTNLYATKVSVTGDGKDIGTSDKWVSPIQYNAFNKDIAEARAAAEKLGKSARAIEPTPEEQGYLDKLETAQKQFNSAKTAGLAAELTVVDDTPITSAVIKQDTTVGGATAPSVTGSLTIEDATLTLDTTGAVSITGVVYVKEGGTLVVKKAEGSNTFSGSLELYSGSTLNAGVLAGLSIPAVVHAGAVFIDSTTPGKPVVAIGPATGDNKGQILQLTTGTIGLTAAAYTLDGDATLVNTFTVGTLPEALVLGSTSTLTIANGGKLNSTVNENFFGADGIGAKIVIATGGSLTMSVSSITASSALVKLDGLTWTEAIDVVSIAGPVTLIKTSADTWKKQ
jgi:hypothetical protein